MQPFYARDFNGIAAGAGNIRAHLRQKVLQIHDFRFFRGVAYHGFPLRFYSGEHDIFRGAHAGKIQQNIGAAQFFGAADDVAVFFDNGNAQPLQPGKMQIDRAQAYIAAAGIGNFRAAKPCEHRTEHKNRRTEFARERGRNFVRNGVSAVDRNIAVAPDDAAAEFAQDM